MNSSLCSRPGENNSRDVNEGCRGAFSQDPDADGYVEQTGSIILNYNKVDGIQSKRGGVKNITCTFCDAAFTGCSRAFAHILGNAVIGPKRLDIGAFVPLCQSGYNHCAQFKNAQRILNKDMMAKGQLLGSPQSKQYILNLTSLTSPGKRTVSGEIKIVKSKC
jgi:hypothetical protein